MKFFRPYVATLALAVSVAIVGCEVEAAEPTHVVDVATPTHAVPNMVQSMFGPIDCDSLASDVELNHHIYGPDEFDALVPMGRMWDSHVTPTDHLYFQLHEERERGLVHTPAAGKIVSIQRFPNDQAPFWNTALAEPDYRVVIAHSCTLFSVFIHLGELTPEITQVTGAIERGRSWRPTPDQEILLPEGGAIALVGGPAFDYSLHDESSVLAGFQIPSRYEVEPWKVHTVDPFEYMSDELRAELLTKNERTVEPYAGKIDYDVVGTAAGNWFMEGTVDYAGGGAISDSSYWTGHLSISYDHIDPAQIRISIGRDIGLSQGDCSVCGGVYAVKDNGPDPADVNVTSGVVTYELTGRRHSAENSRERTESNGVVLGTFLVQVLDDFSIRTEFFKAKSSSEVEGFTDASVIYRR